MKEVTYKEWVKNPTPRMMWCWDNCEEDKKQRKVIYVCNNPACLCPVATLIKECKYSFYQHCAEIEKQRRMTHKVMVNGENHLWRSSYVRERSRAIY